MDLQRRHVARPHVQQPGAGARPRGALRALGGALRARARARAPCVLDVPYGDAPKRDAGRLPGAARPARRCWCSSTAATGARWTRATIRSSRPRSRSDGACVVMPNYALCPGGDASREITLQMVHALAWTWQQHRPATAATRGRITVVGHSAGGHLAAMMLACDWRRADPTCRATWCEGAVDLRPVRPGAAAAHAVPAATRCGSRRSRRARASPALLPAPRGGHALRVAGGDESEEFLRQNALIREAWGTRARAGVRGAAGAEPLQRPGCAGRAGAPAAGDGAGAELALNGRLRRPLHPLSCGLDPQPGAAPARPPSLDPGSSPG